VHADLAAVEGPLAVAPHGRIDPEVHLIHEALPSKLVRQAAAAEGEQIAAMLSLQLPDALGEVALDQRRVTFPM
jgi:hypothetical protein